MWTYCCGSGWQLQWNQNGDNGIFQVPGPINRHLRFLCLTNGDKLPPTCMHKDGKAHETNACAYVHRCTLPPNTWAQIDLYLHVYTSASLLPHHAHPCKQADTSTPTTPRVQTCFTHPDAEMAGSQLAGGAILWGNPAPFASPLQLSCLPPKVQGLHWLSSRAPLATQLSCGKPCAIWTLSRGSKSSMHRKQKKSGDERRNEIVPPL